ncbi:hypothetical protein [Nocardia aurantiaca]|uniref:Uncharacterized protein n=1 Tax=Nocardia aurantiaca TaxID=2675850 RepID=A0A6I3KYY5_9NOCA|nr:hypothetical protein [Nocardia aurantiaca]MTE14188.1 hypothetical protein [Nocardia aurantiaca]
MEIPAEIVQAKNAVEFDLLALPGVVEVGLGLREDNGETFDELEGPESFRTARFWLSQAA